MAPTESRPTHRPTGNRQVKVTSMDDIVIEQVAAPAAAPGHVVVRSVVVGVCGSDMHAALGNHPFIDLPYQPGHEAVGVVTEVGEGVSTVQPGDRIVIEPNLACGTCPQCAAGRYNICATLEVFGCQTPGALADYFAIPADRVHVLPETMTYLEAAFIEPLATPVHAVAKAGELTGRTVAVLGAGPIGLLVLIAAKAAGAARIVVSDLLPSKRERAQRVGATGVVDGGQQDSVAAAKAVLGGDADVVFDCVSRGASLAQAVDLVAKGGQIVVVGVGLSGTTPVRIDLVQDRELRIEGALMYTQPDYTTAFRLIGAGAVPVDDLVTAVYPFEESAQAFRASTDPEQVKVLVSMVPRGELGG